MTLLSIAVGGALGTTARWALGGWVHAWAGTTLPWGTFAVNVLGALLLGFSVRYLEAVAVSPDARAFLTVGVLGAFTTFSTFSYETVALLQEGAWARGMAYAGGSVALGLVGVVAGLALAGLALQRG